MILACFPSSFLNASEIKSTWIGKTQSNLSEIKIVINTKCNLKGTPLSGTVTVFNSSGKKILWENKKLSPWKLMVADLDGDKKQEVFFGVYKKSRFDPIYARRLFIYNWDGKRLVPRWLSSRLTRRFVDFTVFDLNKDGKAEVFALEKGDGTSKRVSVYKPAPFGMDWVAATETINDVDKLEISNSRLAARGKRLYSIKYNNSKLKATREK